MKRLGDTLRRALVPALALVTAFLLGAFVLVLTDFEQLQGIGTDPVGALSGAIGSVVEGYGAVFAGAIGDPGKILAAFQSGDSRDIASAIRPISETLLSATPFIFAGLAVALSFHAGLFNFGVDGQYVMGGLGAGLAAVVLAGQLPSVLVLVLAILGGAAFGAAYGFIPGLLKARTGAHEVITTIMLNTIAVQIAIYVGRSRASPTGSAAIPHVPPLFDLRTIRVDWGFVVALLMTAVVSFVLFRTTFGFELRTVGFSRAVARGAGMRPGRTTILAMTLSGGIVGMASAFATLGTGGSSGPGGVFGFVALALALLGGLKPSGVVLTALLFGALNTGARTMVIVTGIPFAVLGVVIAFAMLFVAAPGLTRRIWRLPGPKLAGEETATVVPPGPPDPVTGI